MIDMNTTQYPANPVRAASIALVLALLAGVLAFAAGGAAALSATHSHPQPAAGLRAPTVSLQGAHGAHRAAAGPRAPGLRCAEDHSDPGCPYVARWHSPRLVWRYVVTADL